MTSFHVAHPPRRNAHWESAREHGKAWALAMGMLGGRPWSEDAFDAMEIARMCALGFPDAPSLALNLLNDWFVWALFVDDHCVMAFKRSRNVDGATQYVERLVAVMAGERPAKANPAELGLADVWARTADVMSADFMKRLARSTTELLRGNSWELAHMARERTPDPFEYVGFRRHGGRHLWATNLVEISQGTELPDELRATPPLRTLEEAFADGLALLNDIHSYEREIASERETSNAVRVAATFLDCGAGEAVRHVETLRAARLQRFEHAALTELIPYLEERGANASVHARAIEYVNALRDYQSGIAEAHRHSSRYTSGPRDASSRPTRYRERHSLRKNSAGYPFALPSFYMPWKPTVNPHLAEARFYGRRWAQEMGIVGEAPGCVWDARRYDSLELVLFAALTHPRAPRAKLEHLGIWDIWAFALDDHFVRAYKATHDLAGAKAFVERLPAFMPQGSAAAPHPTSPVERGLADVWTRTAPGMRDEVRSRFPDYVMAFAEGNLWELGNDVQKRIADPIDYVEMRRKTSGTELSTQLGFLSMAEPLPIELANSTQLRNLVHAFADNVGFRNDIFSYRKEIEDERDVNNGVLVLQHFFQCELQQAVEVANAVMTCSVQRFERIVTTDLHSLFDELRLNARDRQAVREHAGALASWLAGDLAWYGETGRYAAR
ncbi:hypothetical protein LZC95_41290 [Pendulispora brunnea]|uniref:Terpene synthase n=1 Tax=Pendulispora brunnea TaxID=2905690 RepID=A0ABZ2K927_9BACT